MQGQGMQGMGCGQMMGGATVSVENTADGAVIRMSAKDPANVAKVQQHAQMMADCMGNTGPAGHTQGTKK